MNTLSWRALLRNTVLALVVAEIANIVLLVIGRAASMPPVGFGPYMYSSVLDLTALGVVAAVIGYVIARWWFGDNVAKANRWYLIVALILLILSFYPDIAMPWSTDPDQIGWTYGIMANLMLMHVTTFAPVAYYFTRRRI